jgi:hypothetical protein
MAFNVPEEEKPKFNKAVKSGLDLFAKDVQRTLGQLEVLQPQTLVEAYNQPVQAPVTRDLTPLEQYVYEPQPAPEVKSLTETPAKESMVVPQESPQVLSNFVNQAEAQFDRDMVSITPYEQAVTDVVGAEVDSLRNDAGEIAKSPLEVFSKPLDANKVRALGLVDQDGNPTERGQLFYNLQQSGVFNEDGTINEKGQAYLTSIEDMKNPEWFQQPGSKEKFDILWEDGVIRSSSTPGEILSNVTKFAGDAVYGGAELAQQQAMGLAYNSRTWGGLLGMEDSRPDYLKARGEATELSIAENMYKNVIQTSNLIDVGLASDKQFIDESILSPVYGALEKITGIQRPQPPEIEQTNANIKNSKDELVSARYQQWAADQRLADMEAGEIGETVFGIDNAVQKAEAAKQELGDEEFNKVYGRVGAFTNIVGDPTNAIPAAFAVKASKAVPLASRAMLGAQKTMGKIAAMDIAIAQGNTAVQASRAALAKAEPTVNLAQRMAANFAEGAKTQPALLERSAKASQIASRVTAEANQIRSTLPTITAELDSLIAKRNSLATRIPEEYSKKVLQTMELGRQMRAMPAKAVGATLERVGDTISKTDTAVTNFLQERGLDQMYTAAVGAAGVVGLAGNPIIGAIGAGAAALKTGNVLSNYGKLFRYVGKEMENVRGQIPFWKRVAAHTAPGSLGRGFAHTFNMLDLGGVTSDTIRRAGRGIAAAAPTDLMFEYLSDGADMRPETLWQAGAESFVIGGSFAAGGGAFMGTKKRMRELSIGDELNFRRNLTDTRQKALFEAIPAGTRRAISTYAIANPTLNYTFKDSGASRYDPNTNTAVINVNSTNPIKALVAHETLHHTVIKNNMEPGISALFLGDTKNNTIGGLFRSRDGKLDPNFEAFRDGYYKRLGVEGMSNAERDAIYPLDKIAVEYFIEKHADQYAAMAESGELGAVASSGAARRKLGSILETVLPRIPVLKDLHFKSGGMIDKNGAWVTGNGILDAEGVKRDPITNKMFRDMNRRSAGLVPGQFDPLMSDKPDSGAPILLNPSDSIDAELLHPLVQVDDANKPIMKDGKPVALDRATELSRALAGLTAVEVMRRKRAENYAPEKGEAHVDDEGQFQPGWLSNDVLTEMFAKNKYNPEQKRIIREMNKLIRKGAGDRVVMINFPATTRNKAGKVVYKPQGATLRDTVPVAVTISKDGNLLFGLMSVTKLHENIQKRSQDRRGKKLYGGNVDLILRDTQAMMDYHKQGLDSIEFFKQKYGAVEADERKKFINTMFGLLNQKEQAVLNPMLLEDGIKSKDNVYRTYRADRVSKAVPMAPEEYAAMPFSYEAVSQVRMPEAQRAMPEGISPEDLNPVANKQEAQGLWADGKQMFAINEMDEKLIPITSKAMLESYPADAIGWMEPQAQNRFMPEKLDSDYMKAVESGDVEAQQRMVDEAAKQAGYSVRAFHRTNSDKFSVFDLSKTGSASGGNIKFRKPAVFFTVDGPKIRKLTKMLEDKGFKQGYGSREINAYLAIDPEVDYIPNNAEDGTEVAITNATRIKSADPITRDDSGNVIPLSKRFDVGSRDMRFMPEGDGSINLMKQTNLGGDASMIMSAKWGTPKQTSQSVALSDKPENHIVGLSRIKGLLKAKDLSEKQKSSLDDFLVKTASFATDSPGFRDLGTPTNKEEALTIISKVTDRMARNLLSIYDAVPPPIRSYWQRWYPLAYDWNKAQSSKHKITRQVVAGINARLSPGKDWIHNVNMTERILSSFADDVSMTQEIADGAMPIIDNALETKLNSKENKNKPKAWIDEQKAKVNAAKQEVQNLVGMKLSEMTDAQAAQLIRYHTQVVGDNKVLNYFEQGNPVYADAISWQSFSNLEKAINMYRDPSMENISNNMGSDHKIRSFFNNQESPNDNVLRDVTSDTHAVAAAYLLPLSQSSQQVARNFGGSSNAVSGLNGMYYIVADAYRKAADARNVEPRAMQSITWEGARSMFPRGFKKAENVKKVEAIWNRFEKRELTKQQALQEINKLLIDFFAKNPNSRPRFAVLPR